MHEATTSVEIALRCGHSVEVHPASSTFDFPEEAVYCPECDEAVHLITEDDLGEWTEQDGLLVSNLDPTVGYEDESALPAKVDWERSDTEDGFQGIVYDPAVNNYDGEGILYDTGDLATKSHVRYEVGAWLRRNGYTAADDGYTKEGS